MGGAVGADAVGEGSGGAEEALAGFSLNSWRVLAPSVTVTVTEAGAKPGSRSGHHIFTGWQRGYIVRACTGTSGFVVLGRLRSNGVDLRLRNWRSPQIGNGARDLRGIRLASECKREY